MRQLLSLSILSALVLLTGCGGGAEEADPVRQIPNTFVGGWYDLEIDGEDSWRWASTHTSIEIDNPAVEAGSATIRYDLRSINARSVNVAFNGVELFDESLAADLWIHRSKTLLLPPGRSTLTFSTSEPGVAFLGDVRDLRICLRNFQVVETPIVKPSNIPQHFTRGWYDLEGEGEDSWRWAEGHASISIENESAISRTLFLGYETLSIVERSLNASLNGVEFLESAMDPDAWILNTVSVELKPGTNVLTFDTDRAGVSPPGDSRKLYFCFRNLEFSETPITSE